MSLSSEPKEAKIRKCIREVKKLARPELNKYNWCEHDYASNFEGMWHFNDTCQRILYDEISPEEFIKGVEIPRIPVVIKGGTDNWPARKKWMLDKLMKKYRNQMFKCGEDNEGYSVKMKMKYYVRYMLHTKDDSPLYIFDSNFGESPRRMKLLADYEVPKYFQDDLFKHVGEAYRPPYRWFVMGPARSGTGIHVDPLGTSAWNALIQGHKRWSLFPPTIPKDLVKIAANCGGVQGDEAITWYKVVYPLTKLSTWPAIWRPIEILQAPGDIVFVPGGWWHVVLNLDVTTAVTQNFCSKTNFREVWHKTARGRTNLSKRWLRKLKVADPVLWRTALSVDLTKPSGLPSDSSNNTASSSTNDSETEGEEDNVQEEGEAESAVVVDGNDVADSSEAIAAVVNNDERVSSSSESTDSENSSENPDKYKKRFWRRYKKNPLYHKAGNIGLNGQRQHGGVNDGASTSKNTRVTHNNASVSHDEPSTSSREIANQQEVIGFISTLAKQVSVQRAKNSRDHRTGQIATNNTINDSESVQTIIILDSSDEEKLRSPPRDQTRPQSRAKTNPDIVDACSSMQAVKKRRSVDDDDNNESDHSYWDGIGSESDGGFDVDKRARRKEKRARTAAFYRRALETSPNNAMGNIGRNREIHGGRTGTGADPDSCAAMEKDETDAVDQQ